MTLPLADELLLHLVTPDRRAAARHCGGLVRSGVSLEHLVEQGLAPAMAQVGALWEAGVWSAADEHVATAVAEAALSAAAAECAPPPGRGEVVVACVEGDWHSLPSRMLAEVLVSHGWSVRFLGASHPTSLLVAHIARHRPKAVLLSCAVPMALPNLVDAVQAIHDLDVPVYVGGRALGHSPRRADMAGADGWALRAGDAPRLLADTAAPATNAAAGSTSDICSRLVQYRARQADMPDWTQRAMGVLEAAMPAVARFPPQVRERTRADLLHLLDTASLTLLFDDPTLIDEQCAWLAHVLAARRVPPDALSHGLKALSEARPLSDAGAGIGSVLGRALVNLPLAASPAPPAPPVPPALEAGPGVRAPATTTH